MDIWFGFGSEHSSNMVIIGRFTSSSDAKEALALLKSATGLALSEYENGRLEEIGTHSDRSEAVMTFVREHEAYTLGLKDLAELIYEYHPKRS